MIAGRDAEIQELVVALADATAGRGRGVVLVGEAGVGKTALAEHLATAAADAGAGVHWARCVEIGGAPPFWPWSQILRSVAAERHGAAASTEGGASLTGGALLDHLEAPEGPDHFRLFDDVARTLEAACRARPQVFILEDCHRADVASLQLLRFVLRDGDGRFPWLVLVTQRESERDDLRRPLLLDVQAAGVTMRLTGLAPEHLPPLVEPHLGERIDGRVATLLHDATGGNPLFAIALARHLRRSGIEALTPGGPVPVPETVQGIVSRRLADLDDTVRRGLALLAASERTIEPGRGRRLLGSSLEAVVAAGEREGWLDVGDNGVRFAHALIRAAVMEHLALADREAVHRDLAEAIEDDDEGASRYAAVAHHYRLAGPAHTAKAVEYAAKAGEHARRVGAFADAAAHFAQAIELGVPDRRERCRLLVARGVCIIRSGDLDGGRAVCREAWELASAAQQADLMGEAALAFATFSEGGIVNEEIVRLLTGALAALGDGDPGLRAQLRGRLAYEMVDPPSLHRREVLAREAADEAMSTGDPLVIVPTLRWAQSASATPDNVDLCLEWTTAAVDAAETIGDHAWRTEVVAYRTVHRLMKGDADGYRADVARLSRIAAEAPSPAARWSVVVADGCRSLLEGRFEDAETSIARSLEFADTVPNALASWQFQDFSLTWEKGGELDRFEPVLNLLLAMRPTMSHMARSALALIHALTGREQEAEAAVAELVDEVDAMRVPWVWMIGVGWLAEAVVTLGDVRSAGLLRPRLEPFRDLHVIGATGTVAAYWGSVRRHLSNLDLLLGEVDGAVEHAQAALAAHVRVGSVPYTVRSQLELSHALRVRGAPGELERAAALLREASATAEHLGMRSVLERARRASSAVAAQPVLAPLTAGASAEPALVREGDYWTFSYGGSIVRVRDGKGVRYLAALLREPGRELLALDLAGGLRTKVDLRESAASPLLDDRARSQYRDRLRDLDEEMAHVGRDDPARLAKLQDEWDFLVKELKAASGLGGTSRALGTSPGESARVAVTKAIRAVLKKVEAAHPPLGRHFKATIRTGTFCSYSSDLQDCETWTVHGP